MDDESQTKFPISRTGDPSKLLALLTAELRDDDLLDIARCDYGDDAELHLEQLQSIACHLSIPSPLSWHPAEVLQLTRWKEAPRDATNDALIKMHRQRAFCCTVLLMAMSDPESYHDGSNNTLAQLIESLDELPLSADYEAADLLVWLLFRSDPNDHTVEMIFWGLGLIYFALAVPQWNNAELVSLIDWIMANEAAAPRSFQKKTDTYTSGAWLLSKTIYDQHRMKWQRLGSELSGRLAAHHSEQVVEKVKLIAVLLSRNS